VSATTAFGELAGFNSSFAERRRWAVCSPGFTAGFVHALFCLLL
jgi:hypothetical protein